MTKTDTKTDPQTLIEREFYRDLMVYKQGKHRTENGSSHYPYILRLLEIDWPMAIDFIINLSMYSGFGVTIESKKKERLKVPLMLVILEHGLAEYETVMHNNVHDAERYLIFVRACISRSTEILKEFGVKNVQGDTWVAEFGPIYEQTEHDYSKDLSLVKRDTSAHLGTIVQNISNYAICDRSRRILDRAKEQIALAGAEQTVSECHA